MIRPLRYISTVRHARLQLASAVAAKAALEVKKLHHQMEHAELDRISDYFFLPQEEAEKLRSHLENVVCERDDTEPTVHQEANMDCDEAPQDIVHTDQRVSECDDATEGKKMTHITPSVR